MPFQPMVDPPEGHHEAEPVWFYIRGSDVLLVHGSGRPQPPAHHPDRLGVRHTSQLFLGVLDGRPVWAADVPPHTDEPDDSTWENLRSLHGRVPDETWTLAGRAVQLVEWERTHRFCGRCGTETAQAPGERAKKCPKCGLAAFPRLAPAVITLVERGDEMLLARGRLFPMPMYSCLAGFVEPGETLEEAVAREVFEEVGLLVDRVRYFGSQPWPFPHSLMIGFRARYAGGDIVLDENEIVDAQWYTSDALPMIPPRMSIARSLIDGFLAEH